MEILTYDTIARVCMVTSLVLFVAIFAAVLAYIFLFASRDRLEQAQHDALDLAPKNTKPGGRE